MSHKTFRDMSTLPQALQQNGDSKYSSASASPRNASWYTLLSKIID